MVNKKLLQSKLLLQDKTLKDLSEPLNVSYKTVLNKVQSKTEFRATEIQKIIEFLNLTNEETEQIFFN